jgi:hypothetical protein
MRSRIALWLLFKHDALYWRVPWLWSRRLNDWLLRQI